MVKNQSILSWLRPRRPMPDCACYYHIHIRKSGGTSLNKMFLALSGREASLLYQNLAKAPQHRVTVDGKAFVGWNRKELEKGDYFYGFSHIPMHKIRLPRRATTLTCLRDPMSRVLSHYKMLRGYDDKGEKHPCMNEEGPWLGRNFDEFIENIPADHLMAQLYTFSSTGCLVEAQRNLSQVDFVMFTETLAADVERFNRATGLKLVVLHERKSDHNFVPEKSSLELLKAKLAVEYELMRVAKLYIST